MHIPRLTIALLLGAASVLAFAPMGGFPLIWLTLGGLYALLERTTDGTRGAASNARTGALLGAAYGFGLFIVGVSWVYVSLSAFGGMPAPVAALATLLFCGVLSIFPAVACAVHVRFSPPGWWQRGLLFASLWMLAEWLRGWVLTGFPWLAAGYSQAPPSPLAGYAPVLGVYGVTLITAFLATLIAEAARRWISGKAGCGTPRRWRALLPVVIAGLLLGGGGLLRAAHWTAPRGEPSSVALLQGNVAQDLKWRPEKFSESLRIYYRLALENPAQLTVLPETALPAFLSQVPGEYLDELKSLAERQHGDMLLGIAVGDFASYANAAISLGQSTRQRYSKSHLVPFGEFVPPGFVWFMNLAHIPMSDFTPGAKQQTPLEIAGQKVAVNICYEDAFGEEIIRQLPAATLLVNISNVAWFGDSLAPAQHLQIAQLRALETGRMMLRATNTGMTAIVAADGTVIGALKPFTRAALRGEVQGYVGATPYVRWGNWPAVILALLVSIAFVHPRNTVS
ncbi:apolipoprotein N-acyltransferase [Propionivibrio sp.]|uniref:apolipoprotein N-acyltransferase n=1 Tax=Propionivibrio sp. TaxID=2212460 RepID=UPI0025E4042A|nr:apolipoprotein N-acyltransferase [Propionivibrio sp.]